MTEESTWLAQTGDLPQAHCLRCYGSGVTTDLMADPPTEAPCDLCGGAGFVPVV